MPTFSERLRDLREEAGLKQEDVAKKLNISTSAYGYYEQGRNEPSLDALYKLIQIFDASADYLIGTSDKPNASRLVKLTDDLTLSKDEVQIIKALKEYPEFIIELANNPKKKNIASLYRFWNFIQHEIELSK
ncbi:helix-turn-helix transcriptional regulator [Terrilactibacillus sp. S3-3]|nr:helix-turn-helix transcriptional regulator [Terrilactibacillus sp. S3-3]